LRSQPKRAINTRDTESVNARYRCQFFSNLEVSVARGFGSGAAGGRGARGVAQRPTGARCTALETAPQLPSCGCSAGRASWRSSPRHPQPDTLSTTATLGARCAPKAALLRQPPAHPDRYPATPRDAANRHRSRSAPPPLSPPIARQKAGETDIFKLDGTDICTLGQQREQAQGRL